MPIDRAGAVPSSRRCSATIATRSAALLLRRCHPLLLPAAALLLHRHRPLLLDAAALMLRRRRPLLLAAAAHLLRRRRPPTKLLLAAVATHLQSTPAPAPPPRPTPHPAGQLLQGRHWPRWHLPHRHPVDKAINCKMNFWMLQSIRETGSCNMTVDIPF
ncbi:unnamed protein product [Urochloa humidicola]